MASQPCACPRLRPGLALPQPCSHPCSHPCQLLTPDGGGCSQTWLQKGCTSRRKSHPPSWNQLPLEIQHKLHVRWSRNRKLSPRRREPGRPRGSLAGSMAPGSVVQTLGSGRPLFWPMTMQPARAALQARQGAFTLRPVPAGGLLVRAQGSPHSRIPACSLTWSFLGARTSDGHTHRPLRGPPGPAWLPQVGVGKTLCLFSCCQGQGLALDHPAATSC